MPDIDPAADRLGAEADAFYEALLQAHEGLNEDQSARLNARLVLILANRIGDLETLKAALAAARHGVEARERERG